MQAMLELKFNEIKSDSNIKYNEINARLDEKFEVQKNSFNAVSYTHLVAYSL